MNDGDDWRRMDSAPKDGTTVQLRLGIESVQAYWEPDLDRWVLCQPLHIESIYLPLRWKPVGGKSNA